MIRFIRDLFSEPSNFAGDPYGYITNQTGHFMLGFVLCTCLAWTSYTATEVYIDQRLVVLVVCVSYLVWWELAYQGWRGWDTLEDAAYVTWGSASWLYIDMFYVLDRVFLSVLALGVCLLLGAIRRWRRADDDQ